MGDRSKGTGIVEFASVSDAEAAINGFQNYVVSRVPTLPLVREGAEMTGLSL